MLLRLSLAALIAAAAPALAQGAPPLTIRKQSALTGTRVVAPGSLPTWAGAANVAAPVWSYDARFRGPLPERNFMPGPPRSLY
ncbi:MAG: hypothetical protein JNK46_08080 [Methylobacteriaceae bacterium]|nr:hypothetical protein [Methylobacteriaceae bacterium]